MKTAMIIILMSLSRAVNGQVATVEYNYYSVLDSANIPKKEHYGYGSITVNMDKKLVILNLNGTGDYYTSITRTEKTDSHLYFFTGKDSAGIRCFVLSRSDDNRHMISYLNGSTILFKTL